MLMHAQKDLTQKVLNNQTARVDNSMATSVGSHQSTEVGGNANSEVGGSQTNVVGATGAGVAQALAGLAGLMGQTAGLAGQAAGMAGGLGGIQSLVMGVVGQAAQALIGAAGQGGRGGVVDGGTTRADTGAALAGAGSKLLEGVGQMFGQGGVQKNFISDGMLPHDFECCFSTCAYPDFVAIPWLQGDEGVQLLNLHPQHADLAFALPGFRLLAYGGGVARRLRLDGVHIAAGASAGQVELTWRVAFVPSQGCGEVRGGLADEEAAGLGLADAARPERACAAINRSTAL